GDGRQLNYVDEIVNAFANDVNKKNPEILIISGDLTNNGEKESHLQLAQKLEDIEEKAGTRVFVIPGNHDIQNPWARGFKDQNQYKADTIDEKDFKKIYGKFGYEEAISKDESTLSYLVAPSEDVWLLLLDTNLYLNNNGSTPITNGRIGQETFGWIRQCSELAKKNNAKLVTVMHHNLFNHSDVLNEGFTLDNSEEALKVFEEVGINLVLSGHIHIQDIKSNSSNTIYDIATSSLIMYPEQYGVLKYYQTNGFDYSTSRVDVEGWAKETGAEDENINNFMEYSKNYFAEASYNKTYEALTSLDGYSEQDIKLMAETMSLLNVNYFGGTVDSVRDQVIKSQGYNLWEEAESDFLKKYLLSMTHDTLLNNNQLQFTHQDMEKE
ncbi:MAG: metallophosphoesterase, partial [Vallitaleaceae bacterium]|nr:metallophosphoesterase [Vallitaleaceae bacterium]